MATEKRVVFRSGWLPYLLVAPQIAITVIFFFWPAFQAAWYSFQLQDAFGLQTEFVGLRNFHELFGDPRYLESFKITAIFSLSVASIGISISLLLATMANRVIHGAHRLQDLPDLAVRGRLRGRRRDLRVPVRAVGRHRHLRAEADRHPLELGAARRPGDDPGRDRIDLEADQLQLPVLPRRPAVDPEVADRGRRDRRRRAHPALLDRRVPAADADDVLPPGHQHRLRVLRHLRRHRRDDAGRTGGRHQHPRLQGLPRRREVGRPRRLVGAVGRS